MAKSPIFDEIEFAENPQPRCPCILLLDVSGSMSGAKIEALNQGLRTFQDDLNRDDLARKRVEVAVVAFDDQVKVVQDFVTADQFEAPTLITGGLTHMGTAIQHSLDMVEARKQTYRENGVEYYRPWVFMITDGEPQGEDAYVVEQAAQRLQIEEESKRVAFFAVAVQGANLNRLSQIVVRPPSELAGLNFGTLFQWLSKSLQSVSHSKPDVQVPLKRPAVFEEEV